MADTGRQHFYPVMDVMRYVLAMGVLVAHFNELYGADIPYPIRSFESVGGFFVISGFLIYPSYVRHGDTVSFIIGRARRILPPYFFIVLLCAFGLVAVSDCPVRDYFLSGKFAGYLASNISFLNWLQPSLPGVFGGEAVNGSLWTMKVEWSLYLSVPVFVWLVRRLKLGAGTFAMVMVVLSMLYRLGFTYLASQGSELCAILARQVFGQMSYFYLGVLIYFYRDKFASRLLLWLFVGVVLIAAGRNSVYASIFVNPAGISLAVMALSLMPLRLNFMRGHYNLSYDMYLFHFPIIQLAVWLGLRQWPTALAFGTVTLGVIMLSMLSSRYIDRRFLKRK